MRNEQTTPNNYKDQFTEWLESQIEWNKTEPEGPNRAAAIRTFELALSKYRQLAPTWIPVTERMPPKAGYYICWCDTGPEGGEPGLIHYHPETGWRNGFYNDVVTHYQIIVPPINKEQ